MNSSGNTTEAVPNVRDILARHVSREKVDEAFEKKPEAEINEAPAKANAKAKSGMPEKVSKQIERDARAHDLHQRSILGDDF